MAIGLGESGPTKSRRRIPIQQLRTVKAKRTETTAAGSAIPESYRAGRGRRKNIKLIRSRKMGGGRQGPQLRQTAGDTNGSGCSFWRFVLKSKESHFDLIARHIMSKATGYDLWYPLNSLSVGEFFGWSNKLPISAEDAQVCFRRSTHMSRISGHHIFPDQMERSSRGLPVFHLQFLQLQPETCSLKLRGCEKRLPAPPSG